MPDFCAHRKKVTSKNTVHPALVTFQLAWATKSTRKWRHIFIALDLFIHFALSTDKYGHIFAFFDDQEAELFHLQIFKFVINISSRVSQFSD